MRRTSDAPAAGGQPGRRARWAAAPAPSSPLAGRSLGGLLHANPFATHGGLIPACRRPRHEHDKENSAGDQRRAGTPRQEDDAVPAAESPDDAGRPLDARRRCPDGEAAGRAVGATTRGDAGDVRPHRPSLAAGAGAGRAARPAARRRRASSGSPARQRRRSAPTTTSRRSRPPGPGVVDMTSFDYLTLDDDIEQIRGSPPATCARRRSTSSTAGASRSPTPRPSSTPRSSAPGSPGRPTTDATVLLVIQSTQKSTAQRAGRRSCATASRWTLEKEGGRWLLSGIAGTGTAGNELSSPDGPAPPTSGPGPTPRPRPGAAAPVPARGRASRAAGASGRTPSRLPAPARPGSATGPSGVARRPRRPTAAMPARAYRPRGARAPALRRRPGARAVPGRAVRRRAAGGGSCCGSG